jgi:hypothetical protein
LGFAWVGSGGFGFPAYFRVYAIFPVGKLFVSDNMKECFPRSQLLYFSACIYNPKNQIVE